MSISITTQDYIKGVEVNIDGKVWRYVQPGAGVFLDASKNVRKLRDLENKKNPTQSEEDSKLDLTLELFDMYGSMLRDNTEDNSEVKKWLYETPADVIVLVIQEIQKQTS